MATTTYSLNPILPEFTVSRSTAAGNTDELDATLGSGLSVVYVSQDIDEPFTSSIVYDRYDSAGELLNSIELNNPTAGAVNSDPMLATRGGTTIAAWTQTGAASGNGIHYSVFDAQTGTIQVADASVPGGNSSSILGGLIGAYGFENFEWAFVEQYEVSPGEHGVRFTAVNPFGSPSSIVIGAGDNLNEQTPVMTSFHGGNDPEFDGSWTNAAIVFEKELAENTDTFGMAIQVMGWGGTLGSEFVFDSSGTQNRNAVIATMSNGIAVAYEDNEYGSQGISLALFDFVTPHHATELEYTGKWRIDDGGVNSEAAIAFYGSLVFVSYTHRETEGGDGDIELAVLDAATMQIVTRLTLENQAGDQHSSSINVNGGHLVFSWTDENAALEDGNGDANGSHVSVAMGDIVETIVGDDTSETLTGTDLASQIYGEGGNDTLYGGSGPFNYLYGGTGDDIYIVGSLLNTLIEKADEGRDTVRSNINWTLGNNVERLELQGAGNLNGTGNALNNTLVGNAGNNLLDGGAGNDYMVGGAGYDIFVVAAAGDQTIEFAGQGTDTVRSYISWTLADNVEVLELLGSATRATGNASNNYLYGNALDNYFNGMSGDDFMSGGSGNDIYIVGSANDRTWEGVGRGTDTVRSYVDWVLANNVERLELQGSGNLNGTGNTLANTLVGNSGANSLSGGDGNDYIAAGTGNDALNGGAGNDRLIGGAGRDILIGGSGNDTFDFDVVSDSPAVPALRDSINGFSHGYDHIDLATIDSNTLVAGNQAFSFIGKAAFSGATGQLRYTAYENGCLVDGDINGDKLTDFQIAINGTSWMTGTDFVL